MRSLSSALRILWLGLLLALAFSGPAGATSVLPLTFDRIVDDATVAFQGTVTDVHADKDPVSNRVVTYVTFRVDDALKGDVGATYTMKQVGGRLPSGESYRIDGMPSFSVGQSYVVFLTGPSSVGLSSPIGLSQGKFAISAAADGASQAQVSNGRDFREMTANTPASVIPPTTLAKLQQKAAVKVNSIGLDDFKQMVRDRVGSVK